VNTHNDMSVSLESAFHFLGNLQPLFPSPWHLDAIVKNFQQRRIIFLFDPVGSDRWRWLVLEVGHMNHPANVVAGSARCWARTVGGKAGTVPNPAMNSCRRIRHALKLLCGQPIAVGVVWERASQHGPTPGIADISAWLKGAGMTAFDESRRRRRHAFSARFAE
jgi:hypothetical protein